MSREIRRKFHWVVAIGLITTAVVLNVLATCTEAETIEYEGENYESTLNG